MFGWADDASTKMGLSRQSALELTSTMGNMFSQLGAQSDDAGKLSRTMVQLSADIASLNNVQGGAQEVSESMQSAFRGEYDSLQKYIPTINAAAVEHQALADTGKKTAKELTNLEKAMAAYTIITRDAGVAAGDFARTSEGLANQKRILSAQISDFTEDLGKYTLPAYTKMVSETSAWIAANDKLIGQNLGIVIQGIAESMEKMAGSARTASGAILEFYSNQFVFKEAFEYAEKGYLNFLDVLKADNAELRKMVEYARKISQITESGEVRYKIGSDTPGYTKAASATPSSGGASASGATRGAAPVKEWDYVYKDIGEEMLLGLDNLQKGWQEYQDLIDKFFSSSSEPHVSAIMA